MAYVYRHIRLDKNEPFYIGIGLCNDNYKRAYTKSNRTKFWKIISSKDGYSVEVILDNLSEKEAKEKEIEFIKLYGRIDKGGVLCNLTDGGDGTIGYRHTENAKKKLSYPKSNEHKIKIAASKIGKKLPEEVKKKMSESQKGRVQSESCKNKLRNRVFSDETKQRMSAWQKGKCKSEEIRKKMSEVRKGKVSWNKGLSWSEETKEKMRKPKSEEHIYNMKKPKRKMICPYCQFEGGGGNMLRYHFKNCKYGK